MYNELAYTDTKEEESLRLILKYKVLILAALENFIGVMARCSVFTHARFQETI